MIVAIDPGPMRSGVVVLSDDGTPFANGSEVKDNSLIAEELPRTAVSAHVVIEQIGSYGMAVGADVFETVWWSGRLYEAASRNKNLSVHRMKRGDVKLHLCGSMRAKDAHIRQSLIDRYGGTDGKTKAIGTKKNPGPLYGVKSHCWAALALAVTFADKQGFGCLATMETKP